MSIEEANQIAEEFHLKGTAFQNGDASFWREGDWSKKESNLVYNHFFFAKELEYLLQKRQEVSA